MASTVKYNEDAKGKFRVVTHEGEDFELLEEIDTGEETLRQYMVDTYPPEFFLVSATDGMYRLYSQPHVATIVAPITLQQASAEPTRWQIAYVLATDETVWPD
jgi:hypothetical protein